MSYQIPTLAIISRMNLETEIAAKKTLDEFEEFKDFIKHVNEELLLDGTMGIKKSIAYLDPARPFYSEAIALLKRAGYDIKIEEHCIIIHHN